MKFARQFLSFLFFVAVVVVGLVFILPTKQRITKEININLPAPQVYAYLIKLNNFNKWSVWAASDSLIKNTIKGTDGEQGAANEWIGSPEISGQGRMQITALLLNKEVTHRLVFIKPNYREAENHFLLEEKNGSTKVSWTFSMVTRRPRNIFNLFSNLERNMGNDFEEGLKKLKAILETTAGLPKPITYKINEYNFPESYFAQYRSQVSMSEIPSFYAAQFTNIKKMLTAKGETPNMACGLYYEWDEKAGRTDMAAAFLLQQPIKTESLDIITIRASKALYIDYYGAYNQSMDAYAAADKYMEVNKLKQKSPVIEQYLNNPQIVKDTNKWHTKIIFLVQ